MNPLNFDVFVETTNQYDFTDKDYAFYEEAIIGMLKLGICPQIGWIVEREGKAVFINKIIIGEGDDLIFVIKKYDV